MMSVITGLQYLPKINIVSRLYLGLHHCVAQVNSHAPDHDYYNTILHLHSKHSLKSFAALHNMLKFSASSYICLPLVFCPTCSSLVRANTVCIPELGTEEPGWPPRPFSRCEAVDNYHHFWNNKQLQLVSILTCVCLGFCTPALLEKILLRHPCSVRPEYHTFCLTMRYFPLPSSPERSVYVTAHLS